MSHRPSPPCHRGIGAVVRHIPDESVGTPQTPGFVVETTPGTCIGSRCPLWTPEVATPPRNRPAGTGVRGPGSHDVLSVTDDNGHNDWRTATLTGRGWCADNLRTEPWLDNVLERANEKASARKVAADRYARRERGEPDVDLEEWSGDVVTRPIACRVAYAPPGPGESPTVVRVVSCPEADGMVGSCFTFDGDPFDGERAATIDLASMTCTVTEPT